MNLNLLDDPIIPYDTRSRRSHLSLPDLFAEMMSGSSGEIGDVRPHQFPGVHMTFCQIAAAAIEKSNGLFGDECWKSGKAWREALVGTIAPKHAWDVVGKDSMKPAFMQPPMDADAFENIKTIEFEPDGVTTLVASKNHSEKFCKNTNPSVWDWCVALIESQTLASYSGRGWYGTVRMNGGLGSRPMVSLYEDITPSARFRLDVQGILDVLPRIRQDFEFYPAKGGIVATWAEEWNGDAKIALKTLHPLFVDGPRHLRLRSVDGRIGLVKTTGEGKRIAADDEIKGMLGDPWAPINRGKGAILTITGTGFNYSLVSALISGGRSAAFELSPLGKNRSGKTADCYLVLVALAGGQGVTEGFHERLVEIPGDIVVDFLSGEPKSNALAEISARMVEIAGEVSRTCLKFGVFAYVQGRMNDLDFKNRVAVGVFEKADREFDFEVDREFFDYLWTCVRTGSTDEWEEYLKSLAGRVLERVEQNTTIKTQNSFRSIAMGRKLLFIKLHTLFKKPEIKEVAA